MQRVIFRVAPNAARWIVTRNDVAQSDHAEKKSAIEAGSLAARREWELFRHQAECIVHRSDGSAEDTWKYG